MSDAKVENDQINQEPSTPYRGVPLSAVPPYVLNYWESWQSNKVEGPRKRNVKSVLVKWGFLPKVRTKMTDEEKEKRRRERNAAANKKYLQKQKDFLNQFAFKNQ
jgi:hypothetical protein